VSPQSSLKLHSFLSVYAPDVGRELFPPTPCPSHCREGFPAYIVSIFVLLHLCLDPSPDPRHLARWSAPDLETRIGTRIGTKIGRDKDWDKDRDKDGPVLSPNAPTGMS
jgi:hypothetical protein